MSLPISDAILAEQMGTSVKMIEQHYGHVNTIKHADRVLQGMRGWEPMINDPADGDGTARASARAKARLAAKPVHRTRTPRG
jgi:integrase